MILEIHKAILADCRVALSKVFARKHLVTQVSINFDSQYQTRQRLDSDDLEDQDIRDLQAFFKACEIRGAGALATDLQVCLDMRSPNLKDGAKIRKLNQLPEAIKAYFKTHKKRTVYMRSDGGMREPYYIQAVRYHASSQYSPEYVTIDLRYRLFDIIREESVEVTRSDAVHRTVSEILANKFVYIATTAQDELHGKQIERWSELSTKVGTQLTATGHATVDKVPDTKERRAWSAPDEWDLGRDGQPARLVIDAFHVSDRKSREDRDSDATSDWWDGRDGAGSPPDVPDHPYLVCFDLRKHQRMRVHIDSVTEYDYKSDIGHHLVIPKKDHNMLDVLLASSTGFTDVVQGKSGGVVVLLQGPPGVGKTLTVEVFAETAKRPLYVVQCSQLGTDPEEIETNLCEILANAKRWNAIVLLDECDSFTVERGTSLIHNAIVGVFLRTLEHHNSTVFLATNRGDDVDPAILSRCVARLKYSRPNRAEQQAIWGSLCKQNGLQATKSHIERVVAQHDLTGREIKNVLKLCLAMMQVKSLDFSAALVSDVVPYVVVKDA